MSEKQPNPTPKAEKSPDPVSPELLEAQERARELRDRYNIENDIFDGTVKSSIDIWGSEENMAQAVKDYHTELSNNLKSIHADLVAAELAVKNIEVGAGQNFAELEDAVEASDDIEEGSVLEETSQLENEAKNSPEAKEKLTRKIGKWIMGGIGGALLMGAAFGGGYALGNNNSEEEERDTLSQSQEAFGVTDIMQDTIDSIKDKINDSSAEVEDSAESIRAYETPIYEFYKEGKTAEYNLDAPSQLLDKGGNLIPGSNEEHVAIYLDELENTFRHDPSILAMHVLGSDLSSHESLKQEYLNNPDAWRDAANEIMAKYRAADIDIGVENDVLQYSVYGVGTASPEANGAGGGYDLRIGAQEWEESIARAEITVDGKTLSYKLECGQLYVDMPEDVGLPPMETPPETPPEVTPPTPETPDPPQPPTPEKPPVDPPVNPPVDPPTPPPTETPEPKDPTEDINVNPDLPDQLKMDDERVVAPEGDLQGETDVVVPPEVYIPPAPIEQAPVAPEAVETTPEQRAEEVEQAPVADGEGESVVNEGRVDG